NPLTLSKSVSTMNVNLRIVRWLGVLEGISYLLLLGICMPLKYYYQLPEPTAIVGMAHGILFIAYCFWVLLVGREKKWTVSNILWSLLASLLPFGTFVADRYIFRKSITTESL